MDTLIEVGLNEGKKVRLPKTLLEKLAYKSIQGRLPTKWNERTRNLLARSGLDFNELEVYRFIKEVKNYPSLEQMYNFYVNLVLLLNRDVNLVGHKDKMFTIILGTKFIDKSGNVSMEDLEQALISLESYRVMQAFVNMREG